MELLGEAIFAFIKLLWYILVVTVFMLAIGLTCILFISPFFLMQYTIAYILLLIPAYMLVKLMWGLVLKLELID